MGGTESDSDYTSFGTLKLARPSALPEVIDLVIAGGGPAGTAAAARAKEYGLSCLVIDYDDLMKRIRDYPKEKLIKPNYGGGDKLQWPEGGPIVQSLYFDDIDKDSMVVQWKSRYKEYGLSARIGSEFTGLQRAGGVWEVKTWNHRAGKEMAYRARHVVIAIGAGVPRRFDIPGNTDGIAFRLDDAKTYVGAPALVIGGGTSAAEAVIAISNAKINAEDPSPVYWSYRGDKMPKVSKALSEVFFDAYVGNGNIRFLPFSEPVAVVTAPDKNEYLSLRIDRKVVEGRPVETVHLEFPKNRVVANIGEDLPVKFLQSIGVKIVTTGGPPMMLLNRDGETNLEGVFLAGDVRGPKYLRCTSFEDQSTFEKVTMKRNIKAAMVEAVQAVEVIAARMGKATVKVEAAPIPLPIAPPTPSEPAAARAQPREAQLVSLQPDGTPEESFPLNKESFSIGRSDADLSCAEDVYMADLHARIVKRGGQYLVEDSGTGSGVWIRIDPVHGRALGDNDVVWVGTQILMATRPGGRWAVAHYDADGVYKASYPVEEKGLFVGRASGITLEPGDMSLSRRHAQFRVEGGQLKVFDCGSRNGTWLKLTAPVALGNNDELRVASKRFRFESFAPVEKLAPNEVAVEAPTPPSPPLAAEPAAAPAAPAVAAGGLLVTLEHDEYPATFPVEAGQDVLSAYCHDIVRRHPDCKRDAKGHPDDHHGEPLDWSCWGGICGLCVFRIIDGADNFLPHDAGGPELNTLEKKSMVEPDPRRYRLACLSRIKGPVKIGIPD